ncbi:protein of unknown function [Flavobacterium collinsii]|uniref:Uncharacterized protein n=1 Tax=Flavobacterium collinsii TaxID=1114861 RepID=A0A9W4X320_9FLAO|nr:protein of unknown function [Flavobacterium collinsii]
MESMVYLRENHGNTSLSMLVSGLFHLLLWVESSVHLPKKQHTNPFEIKTQTGFLNNNLKQLSSYKYYLILKKLAHSFDYNLFFRNIQQHITTALRMEFSGCR